MRRHADEHAVDGRRGLDSRRGVDDVAGDERLALRRARIERDERLARVDCDAYLEPVLDHCVSHGERGPHRALRVVLMRDRRAEDGHHRVADELLDRSAESLELVSRTRVVRRELRADVLGIGRLGMSRVADEVDEHDAHHLPFLARGSRRQRGAEPQPEQKRASSALSRPQLGQTTIIRG